MRDIAIGLIGIWSCSFLATTAYGQTVTDHYKTIINRTPYQVEVCTEVSQSGDKTGDAMKGAIIGGLLGNNIKGEENGGAIGAIIGGMLGHANSNATGGTKTSCRLETRYNEESVRVYSHSTATFYNNGKQYTLRFQK
jgi:outer membrane lipoprotein SlyB